MANIALNGTPASCACLRLLAQRYVADNQNSGLCSGPFNAREAKIV